MTRYARTLMVGVLGVLLLALVTPAFAAERPRTKAIPNAARLHSLGVTATSADDEIPGVAASMRPIVGDLDEYADLDDVFPVSLVASQSLQASIQSPEGADFDLYLFAPGAVSIWTDPMVASAETAANPDAFSTIIPTTGTYFLDASAFQGSGGYTITITENVKPTVALGPAIDRGDSTSVEISAMDLGGSGVRNITYQLDGGSPVTVMGSVATVVTNGTGSHTITATASDGSNNLSLPATVKFYRYLERPVLDLTCSKTTPAYGEWIALTARLTHGGSGIPIPGKQVVFFHPIRTDAMAGRGSGTTDANGVAHLSVRPDLAQETLQALVWGDSLYRRTESAIVTITPKVSLSRPNAPTTMVKGKPTVVFGYLKPRHLAGTYPVRIYKYRYVSGKWKAYGYVKAKAANYVYSGPTYTPITSKYSRSMSLPYKGRWRLRAFAPADVEHAATWSAFEYVTVK